MEKQEFPLPGLFSEEEAVKIKRKIYKLIGEVKQEHKDLPETNLEVELHSVAPQREPSVIVAMEFRELMVIIAVSVGNPFAVAFLKRIGENVADYLSRKLGIK